MSTDKYTSFSPACASADRYVHARRTAGAHCAVSTGSAYRLMDPQPNWHEAPSFNGLDSWGARYIGATYNRFGEPEQTVGEDWHTVPVPGAVPFEQFGQWYWLLPNDKAQP